MLAATGCGEYRLRGLVVEGDTAAVLVVDDDDPRLAQHGLSGAVIELTVEPNSLRPKSLGAAMTDDHGQFDMAIDQPGAGLLEYDIGILCRLDGYRSHYETLLLPGSNRRLLIIVHEGRGVNRAKGDLLQETLDLKDQLMD